MKEHQKQHCRKKTYQKTGFELKLFIIGQIHNGQISINHAAKKYGVSRSSIQYWIKKYSSLEPTNKTMVNCLSATYSIKWNKYKTLSWIYISIHIRPYEAKI